MRRNVYAFILVILVAVFAAALSVSAQDVTTEPIPVTVEVTIQPPVDMTTEPTAEATLEGTMEATAEVTAQPTAASTSEMMVTPEMTTVPTDTSAYLRIAHFAPDAPAVDVYFNGSIAYKKLIYQSMSNWLAVDPGTYSIAVVPNGESVSSTAFAPVDVSAESGTWKTVAIVGSADSKTLQAAVITEDYSDLLPSTGGFTFFNAVEGSDPVNLVKAGVVYFAQIGFPGADTTSSSSLLGDAGTFDVSAVDPNDPAKVFAERTGLELPENAYTFVALIGTKDDAMFFVNITDESAVEIAQGTLPEPGTLLEALNANDNLTAFADAIQSAGLTDLLTGAQPYTIFAPANFAMDMGSMTTVQKAAALQSYIVKGKYTSKQVLDTGMLTALDGTKLTVTTSDNAIFVNGVQVIDVNIAATNGVIHMLNGLWSPAQ
ncbi:MAG: DUF4397 domain-containing protein [Chloroflexota bacterium]